VKQHLWCKRASTGKELIRQMQKKDAGICMSNATR
jgi:hypothetical protein